MRPRRREHRKARLLGLGGVAFLIHLGLVAVFSLVPWYTIIQAQPTVYSVTITSLPLPGLEPERPIPLPSPSPPPSARKIEKTKKDDIVEKVKKSPKKVGPSEEKVPGKSLREALEDVSKKRGLEEMGKKAVTGLDSGKKVDEPPPVQAKVASLAPAPPVAPSAPATPAPEAPTLSPPTSSRSQVDPEREYASIVKAKVLEEWTIPENLFKEMVDLETIIVVIIGKDGKIRKYSYDKESGNPQYDELAMRALKKAEPLPPIPKELNEDTIEIGFRFTAEDYQKAN